jgi:drug/metabolite transporter (DMT)-like permease
VLVAQLPLLALAGLLYLGARVGLLVLRWLWRSLGRGEAPVSGHDWGWLAGAILAGGVVAPVLLMLGLQHTQAASAVVLLAERPGFLFWVAAALMAIGVWLHVIERHDHPHRHEHLTHTHMHRHDEHHRHEHARGWDGIEPHSHKHEHAPLVHTHPHYPDLHQRHGHG